MAYLIDGHNLIGKIPWIDLSASDDEDQLIKLLQEFSRIRRKKIEVFFDQAPPGFSGKRNLGNLKAVFVARGNTADEAIHVRLRSLGKSAPNWTVVSSDHQVQRFAREYRAAVLPSEAFVNELKDALRSAGQAGPAPERLLSDKEVDYWMNLFKGDPTEDDQGWFRS